MTTRAELEAALAQAQADVRKAAQDLDEARGRRVAANAKWDKVVEDRRKAHRDRRQPESRWDHSFADRRQAQVDRRGTTAALATLIQEVAARDKAYQARSKVETDCTAAESRLQAANASRDQATAALEKLNRA